MGYGLCGLTGLPKAEVLDFPTEFLASSPWGCLLFGVTSHRDQENRNCLQENAHNTS